MFLLILPDSGSMRNGECFERLEWVPRKSAGGFISWPTATGSDSKNGGREGLGQVMHPGVCLNDAVKKWPTPQAHDSLEGKTPEQIEKMRARTGAGVANLNETASTWRTPDAPNAGGPRSRQSSRGAGHQVTIAEQAEHWPTPMAHEARLGFQGRQNPDAKGSQQSLTTKAMQWPTPEKEEQVSLSSLQGQPVESGELSLQTDQNLPQLSEQTDSKPKLNPAFVEWLMGLPFGWTSSELAATEWFRWLRLSRLEFLRIVQKTGGLHNY